MSSSRLFFCAIGGSGMLPLALIAQARGTEVCGSDRAFDQGRTPERFGFIQRQGLRLFPQDGSGVTQDTDKLIVSTAVEETVPDVIAAKRLGVQIVHRAQLLAELFNASPMRIGIAGTSGKSTTTALIGWILHVTNRAPTIVNGATMKNFSTPDMPFASAVIGSPDLFVAEVDESDGSIAHFTPSIAVVNNIALDHKSMDELRALFKDFAAKASYAVLNLDNEETAALAAQLPADRVMTFSLNNPAATLLARDIDFHAEGARFNVVDRTTGQTTHVDLPLPGHHNVSNALAALTAARATSVDLVVAAEALSRFDGVARRLDIIGTANGVTVIDDFAHNPDKIGASLRTLHQTPGRLLVLFQPHGYGPLRLMRKELTSCFAQGLAAEDKLYLPDPLYLGGTVNREVTSSDLAADIAALGSHVQFMPTREACAEAILAEARPGDRFVIMGARDDTLTTLAKEMLEHLAENAEQ